MAVDAIFTRGLHPARLGSMYLGRVQNMAITLWSSTSACAWGADAGGYHASKYRRNIQLGEALGDAVLKHAVSLRLVQARPTALEGGI